MFDFTDPGFLGFMESEGVMDTNEGLIARVAKVLENSPNDVIDTEEFRAACVSAGVDYLHFIPFVGHLKPIE